ncbi:MAG: preprotein translocase subunit SecE [Coriobacteriales bacterium]|nr:preprotein translocase subunit SecE [Coriobacteriales bacterium]
MANNTKTSGSAEASDIKVRAKRDSSSATPAATKAAKQSGKDTKKDVKKESKKAKKPNVFKRIATYVHNVRLEVKRTTWPTRSEVGNMTIIVIIALLFFGVIIFALDWIMVFLLGLYGQVAPTAQSAIESVGESGETAVSLVGYLLMTGGL